MGAIETMEQFAAAQDIASAMISEGYVRQARQHGWLPQDYQLTVADVEYVKEATGSASRDSILNVQSLVRQSLAFAVAQEVANG